MNITFHPLENTTTAFFHELYHSSFYKSPGEPQLPFEAIRNPEQEEPGYGFVAPDVPEFGIAIIRSERSGGIGKKLLSHFLKALRERGDKQVSLSVHRDNNAAQWYQRMGFRIVAFDGKTMTMVLEL